MMLKGANIRAALIISILLASSWLAGGCATKNEALIPQDVVSQSTTLPAIAPYIPPAYYECISVLPLELENAYYSMYGNHAEAETMYNGKIFVFKNQMVDLYMIREIDKGWLWADLIKCPVINLEEARNLKPGNMVDIVGVCMGRDLKQSPGLYFRDCYVMPTGSVQLPAPGGGSVFAPGY